MKKFIKNNIGNINYLFLQLFFFRLAYQVDYSENTKIIFHVIYWIIPFTGWSTEFKYIGKKRSIKIIK